MEARLAAMVALGEPEFNSIQFEKRLTNLKDSQESINASCHWCLENRQHHKRIVTSWLNVLKRVKVEQRLVLFYLANDVIQYSKRRNYDFVESWGTTLQKATTMVRDEKVKHKILRIFHIWEQRGVYNEEFISDLCGLISAAPSARKGEEPHEFQSSYLTQKIKNCTSLESDTDSKLKKLKEHNPKIQVDVESLISSLKDRAHVDDVEKEIEEYTKHIEAYVGALKLEIKARSHLVSLLVQSETQLENDRKDVKLVANAYKTFAARVKMLKKKLDEKIPSLSSPVPSPDINAPSPSPDSDIELPGNGPSISSNANVYNPAQSLYTNAGYYTPVPPPNSESNSFTTNSFTSFMGANMPFDLQNFNASSLFGNNQGQNTTANSTSQTQTTDSYNSGNTISSLFPALTNPPPPPVTASSGNYRYGNSTQIPLIPPPMPPFNKQDEFDGLSGYSDSSSYNNGSGSNYNFQPPITTYQDSVSSYSHSPYQRPTSSEFAPLPINPYPPTDEYNPEEEPETWEPEPSWDQLPSVELDTPESPPLFEKEGYGDPIEYHDSQTHGALADVDHRVLPVLPPQAVSTETKLGHRGKDVDHRNLISLTGSPADNVVSNHPLWNAQGDQDYRKSQKSMTGGADQDYRVPLDIEQLKLPPPPPPPSKLSASPTKSVNVPKKVGQSPRKLQDNTESIDMELSDDELSDTLMSNDSVNDNLTVITPILEQQNVQENTLEPPPPFPELRDDVDANNFLDDLDLDLEDSEFISELSVESAGDLANMNFKSSLLGPPPGMFADFDAASGMWNNLPPHMRTGVVGEFPNINNPPPGPMMPPPNWDEQNMEFGFRGRGNLRGNFFPRGNRGNTNEFRGRGRGANWNARGANNFRGNPRGRGWVGNRGNNRGARPRGNFRGSFRGGF